MLRLISGLLLLIISQISFATITTSPQIIPATPTVNNSALFVNGPSSTQIWVSSSDEAAKYVCVTLKGVKYYWYGGTTIMCSNYVDHGAAFLGGYIYTGTQTTYSCSSGTLSDSSGNPSATGQYCSVTVDLTCSQIAANGSYELGSGWSVAGIDSTQCIQANASHACVISNSKKSIWFGKVTDTCSIAMGSGSYWSYTGADCSSVGSGSNYYSTSQIASSKCITPVTSTTSGATSTTSGATSTDSTCPYGSGSITDGTNTITVCLDKPLTTTPTTSSAGSTAGTDSTSSAGSTTSTTSSAGSTTNNDNSTTNNNTSSSVTNGGTSGAGSTTSGAGSTSSGAASTCPAGDDSVTCAKLGSVSDAAGLVAQQVNFGYSADANWWGGGSGSCVADYKIADGLAMSFEPLCKTFISVRPVLIGVCFLLAAGILFGFRKSGDSD